MAITKQKKAEIIEKLQGIISKATSLVFVQFKGLNANDTANLRKDFRGKGLGYMVAKKTLLKRALSAKKINGEIPELGGEIAVAYGDMDDALAPSREVYAFHRGHKESFIIAGGVFEGAYRNAKEMMNIATIPGREVLLGQIAALLNSPVQRFAVALKQIAEKKQ